MAASASDAQLVLLVQQLTEQLEGVCREVARQAEVIGGMSERIVLMEYEEAKRKARAAGKREVLCKLEEMQNYLGLMTKATGAALSQQAATFKAVSQK